MINITEFEFLLCKVVSNLVSLDHVTDLEKMLMKLVSGTDVVMILHLCCEV